MNLGQRIRLLHRAWRYRLHAERHEISLVNRVLQAGDVVLDVGAHKAAFTYWMAKRVGPQGRVIAFEPNPDLVQYLNQVAAGFNDQRVQVVAAALSCKAGNAWLHFPGQHLGSASLELTEDELKDPIQVDTIPLDSFLEECPDMGPIAFVKCDVEYHELAVLRGACRMLVSHKPIMLIESGDFEQERFRLTPVLDYLNDLGFQGFFFRGSELIPIEAYDPAIYPPVDDDHQNYVFVHPNSKFVKRLSSHLSEPDRLASVA